MFKLYNHISNYLYKFTCAYKLYIGCHAGHSDVCPFYFKNIAKSDKTKEETERDWIWVMGEEGEARRRWPEGRLVMLS